MTSNPDPSSGHSSDLVGPCGRLECARLCTQEGLAAAREAHHSRMFARALRVLADPHLAEEAVQEAWVRAWQNCAAFDPVGVPMAHWLIVLTRNVAIDMAKARSRRPPLAQEQTRDGTTRSEVGRSEADLFLLRAELASAMSTIGPQHREAVVEVILRDRPYADVSSDLGVPAGTLRSRVHYALRALRDAIGDAA